MINVVISHYSYKYYASIEEQSFLNKFINDLLEPILIDCIIYNASVKAIITQSGNYKFEPICDQYSTFMAMQNLLPEVIPTFK